MGEKISPINFDFSAEGGPASGGEKDIESGIKTEVGRVFKNYEKYLAEIRFNEALAGVWELISFADKYINKKKPWGIVDEKALKHVIINAGYIIGAIANLLEPFLPETAEKIKEQINFSAKGGSASGGEDSVLKIKKGGNLFPRL